MASKDKMYNWDADIRNSSYREVEARATTLPSRPPSMFSKDRKLFYLSSTDNYVEVDNQGQLEFFIPYIRECFVEAEKSKDYMRAYIAEKDFEQLNLMLFEVTGNKDYAVPAIV